MKHFCLLHSSIFTIIILTLAVSVISKKGLRKNNTKVMLTDSQEITTKGCLYIYFLCLYLLYLTGKGPVL